MKTVLACFAASGACLALAARALSRTPDADRRRAYPNEPERWAGNDGTRAPFQRALRSPLFYMPGMAFSFAALGASFAFSRTKVGALSGAALGLGGGALTSLAVARALLPSGKGAMERFVPTSKSRLGAHARVLFVCGSPNQTTQMHKIAAALPEVEAWFTPYFSDHWTVRVALKLGWLETTIAGLRRRGICLDYLNANDLPVDLGGERNEYHAYVTCNDQVLPSGMRRTPWLLVQEGIQEPANWRTRLWSALRKRGLGRLLPAALAGTATFGLSNGYAKFCVASEGYKNRYIKEGIPAEKLEVTGIPNFDDFARFRAIPFPLRGYLLVCTSDARETWLSADRQALFARAVGLASGRPIVFKLHPNENIERATAEIRERIPEAQIFSSGSAEAMVAHCDVLLTEWSSLTFCGIALGKEVHSLHPLAEVEGLLPLQNGRAAEEIAAVVRRLLGGGPTRPEPKGKAKSIERSAV